MKAIQLNISIENFFKKEYKKLINYVRRNIEERYFEASPEDIIQDVALSLLSRLDANAQIENIAAYVYRSLKNRIIDTQRNSLKSLPIENFNSTQQEIKLINTVADETNIDESELERYDFELLHEAILQLNPDEQAIIISTEFENITFKELSERLGVPIGTLLSRKHRALSKLYSIITKKQKLIINENVSYGIT
jgi:RNA polymerase sigma-70 factor (ECF subfamily)